MFKTVQLRNDLRKRNGCHVVDYSQWYLSEHHLVFRPGRRKTDVTAQTSSQTFSIYLDYR